MLDNIDKKKKKIILTGILTGILLSSLTSTIVSTAMPKIISSLGGIEYLSWTFTAFMLTSTISIPIFGKLSDLYGRKRFYLTGIFIFMLGSILSGTSINMVQLIIYRALTGVGAGIMMSNSIALVADIYPPAERGKYQGFIGAVFGFASIIGPTLGGYITDSMNWRWVFWVNIPVGVMAVIILSIGLPSLKRSDIKKNIDYLGVAFLTLTFAPLLLAFSWAGTTYPWGSIQIIGLIVLSVLGLIFFIVVERRAIEPIVPMSLFKNSIFIVSILSSVFTGIGMFGTIMFVPLFIQGAIGITATNSGMIITPMMISLVIGSTISGQITSRTGKYKKIAIIGFMIMVIGMVLLTFLNIDSKGLEIIIFMIVVGFGLGTTMPIFVIAVQNAFSHNLMGVVSSSVQFFRNIGGTFGVALMGTVLNLRFKIYSADEISSIQGIIPSGIKNLFDNPQTLFNPELLKKIESGMPESTLKVFKQALISLKSSLAFSIRDVFIIGSIIIFAAFVVTFFLKEIPLRKTHKPSSEQAGMELMTEGVAVEGVLMEPDSEPELIENNSETEKK